MVATGFSETVVSITELHGNIKSQKTNLIFAVKGNWNWMQINKDDSSWYWSANLTHLSSEAAKVFKENKTDHVRLK